MVRVPAVPPTTEVVELQTIRDWAIQTLPRKHVCQNEPSTCTVPVRWHRMVGDPDLGITVGHDPKRREPTAFLESGAGKEPINGISSHSY